MKEGSIKKDNKTIRYKIRKRSKKNIIIKINELYDVEVSIPPKFPYKTGEGFLELNFEKIYLIIEKKKEADRIFFEDEFIVVLGEKRLKSEIKNIEDFLMTEAKRVYKEILDSWIKNIGVKPNKIKIKKMKSAWGICYSNKNITLNLKLIHLKRDLIEYVIVHELCHLHIMNHSKEFWNLVERFIPDYMEKRKSLKTIKTH